MGARVPPSQTLVGQAYDEIVSALKVPWQRSASNYLAFDVGDLQRDVKPIAPYEKRRIARLHTQIIARAALDAELVQLKQMLLGGHQPRLIHDADDVDPERFIFALSSEGVDDHQLFDATNRVVVSQGERAVSADEFAELRARITREVSVVAERLTVAWVLRELRRMRAGHG